MKKGLVFCLIIFLFQVKAKGQNTVENDTFKIEKAVKERIVTKTSDSANWVKKEKIDFNENQLKAKAEFKPNPKKAIIYSIIFPGMGQLYNRKYWKLPIIYGGLLGLSYGISWNGQYYGDYKSAYSAISVDDPRANFNNWKDMSPYSNISSANNLTDSQIESLKNGFKRQKDVYRRNRDLCIIGVVAVYAICMIDAYVDAQLFDFDISPDLSLQLEPSVMQPTQGSSRSFGVNCNIKF